LLSSANAFTAVCTYWCFWVAFLVILILFKDSENSWLQTLVFCSVAVIHYLSPGCQLHGALQRVDFLCAVGLSVSSGRYIPLLGRDLAKRRCQSVLWVIGSWVHCQHLYDAGMILRSHWRRFVFVVFSPFFSPPLYEDLYDALDWALAISSWMFWSYLSFWSFALFSYLSTRLILRAVNPRNGNATYSHEINCRLHNVVMCHLNYLRSSGC